MTLLMRHIIILILSSLLSLTLYAVIFSALPAHADVPVWVTQFDACTDYQVEQNAALADVTQAIIRSTFRAETKLENFLQTFKLGQIEKAREDVAKITWEVLRELKDEGILWEDRAFECTDTTTSGPLLCTQWGDVFKRIVSQKGIRVVRGDQSICPGGFMADIGNNRQECVIIKKESRIIVNVDDYFYEEPIEKARHYVQCYLAPWRFFPFADDTVECPRLGIPPDACTSRRVCEDMSRSGAQCESDKIRDRMKFDFLNKIQRKDRFIYSNTNPPESWYSEGRCSYILGALPTIRNAEPPGLNGGGSFIEFGESQYQFEVFKDNEPNIDSPPKSSLDNKQSWGEYEKSLDQKNNFAGVFQKVADNVDRIINEYQEIRKAEFIAGQGIRPEKFLIGWLNENGPSNVGCADPPWYGRKLIGCGDPEADGYFFFSTEDVIAPAVILLQKMQSATQAQFDLAQNAFKTTPSTVSNEDITLDIQIGDECIAQFQFDYTTTLPGVEQLPAPWEDQASYAEIPTAYGQHQEPLDFPGEGWTLNEWYKRVIELYEHSFTQPRDRYNGLPSVLKEWFGPESEVLAVYSPTSPGGGGGGGGGKIAREVTGLPGVFVKDEYMARDIENGTLAQCIADALRGLPADAGGQAVITETNRNHSSGQHVLNQAVDIRTNGKSGSEVSAMMQHLLDSPGRTAVLGPDIRLCSDMAGKNDCHGHRDHIHFSCQ